MRERLQRLSNTAHSIQTLSMWILHHQKKNADAILETWLKEVMNNTDNERLISLMNLANDVIQNARKKAPSFMNSFYEVLQPAISHISSIADPSYKNMLARILSVWRERSIYSIDRIEQLFRCISDASSPNLNSDPETPIKNSSPIELEMSPMSSAENAKKIKEEFQAFSGLSTSLVNVLRRLEDPASADLKIRQLIAGYPENIANPALLKQVKTADEIDKLLNKIAEAVPVVDAYCDRLTDELKDRQNLQYLIMDFVKALEQANERNRALVESVQKRIHRLDREKQELSKHIESLPDLSQMTSTTTLPPLGELFTST